MQNDMSPFTRQSWESTKTGQRSLWCKKLPKKRFCQVMWTVTFIVIGAGWGILEQLLHLCNTEKNSYQVNQNFSLNCFQNNVPCVNIIFWLVAEKSISQWSFTAREGQVELVGGWGVWTQWHKQHMNILRKKDRIFRESHKGSNQTQWDQFKAQKQQWVCTKEGRVTFKHPRV